MGYNNKYISQSSFNTELYHHGVIGMKWGVRRYQPYGEGGYDPKNLKELKNRAKRSFGYKNTKTLKEARKKDIDEMSDEELRKYNNRLQLEKQYIDLTKGAGDETKKWVKNTIITSIATGVFIETGKAFLKKKLDIS